MRSASAPAIAILIAASIACGGSNFAWAAPAPAAAANVAPEEPACGDFMNLDDSIHDYRRRESTPALSWSVADIKNNHYDPATKSMNQGVYSRNVAADLHFMLRGWPNHYAALQARIRYDLRGGHDYEFPSTECYFARARKAFPDDVGLVILQGYYSWKKGDRPRARKLYEEALTLDPDSVDAHYNLGLVCAEMSDFDEAVKHAQVAYGAGYPLPGLRNKLERAGRWPPRSADATQR
jgi:tetratricopeptide (TPR) repeat protein